MKKFLYLFMWWGIAIVSCIDLYWAIHIGDNLREIELNPLGVYLMDVGGLELFMASKMIGTILVLSALSCMYKKKPKIGWVVTTTLFILQLVLCCHLFNVNTRTQLEKKTEEYKSMNTLAK